MMKLVALNGSILFVFLCGSSAWARHWPSDNDPESFLFRDETLVTKLNLLPKVANVVTGGGHIPFSDTYWPNNDIGIAVRYADILGNPTQQELRSDVALAAVHPSLAQLKKMSVDEINTLSPAEKFDIANGNYDYPLTRRVVSGLSGDDSYAYGMCHGWSPAASNYSEPQKTTYVNKDGIVIPFGSSDVKGILAFYYAWEVAQVDEKGKENTSSDRVLFEYRIMGQRCTKDRDEDCPQTVNPGALHLALANIVGRYHRSFELQANNSSDLWNYPILGYASTMVGGESINESGHSARVKVVTDLYFTDATEPTHETTNGKALADQIPLGYERLGLSQAQTPGAVDSRHLVYTLDLDEEGNIVGGKWDGEASRGLGRLFSHQPDTSSENQKIGFVWRASRVPFRAQYQVLNDIYRPLDSTTNVYQTEKNE